MPEALNLFGDALPAAPAADACPACGGPTTRRGRECLPCLAAGVTAARLDFAAVPTVARDVARTLTPHALATWPTGPTH